MRGIRSDRYRRLIKIAVKQGWSATWDGSNHIRVTNPETGRWFKVSSTLEDKDGHSYQNTRKKAREAGLDVSNL